MRPLRVTLVAESFYPAVDGTTTTVKAIADRLVDTGHTVEIVAPGPGLTSYRGCVVRRISPLAKPGAQVAEALEQGRPDVVVATGSGTLGTLARKALKYADKHAGKRGIRSVVVQTSAVPDLLWDQWRSKVEARAGRVLVTAPWLVERMAGRGVVVDLWLPGVDTAAFSPALRDTWLHDSWARAKSAAGPQVVVGYVGSLHKRHGVRHLVELAGVPGIRLVVIGDGPQRGWLQSRLPGAKFTGALETGELAVALASLDVLVHPGQQETCCHVLREAAASGVPVVAPRAGGAGDLVAHLETGLLYDPIGPQGLVRAVRAVVADRHRAMMGVHARAISTRSWIEAVDELVLEHLGDLPSDQESSSGLGSPHLSPTGR